MPTQERRSWRRATLAPFRHRIFLALWTASLVSNFGGLIQVVGASWLMTSLAGSADMVALVQAATTTPIMLLSLAAGATADIWDRRTVMLIAQAVLVAASAALTVMGYLGQLTPWSLLGFTFLIGVGTAIYGPAWQASVGEQVPRAELSAAVSLNSLGFNLARTAGPALGGALVAVGGPPAAFLANTLSYMGLIAVLLAWRRPRPRMLLPPEGMLAAMGAGLRYARLSPGIRAVLTRAWVFGTLGSAVWALMPLIARDLVGGGALTYGVLFAAFGAGAVLGALVSATARLRYANEGVVRAGTLVFGAGTVLAAVSHVLALTAFALALTGAAWVATLSTFNVTVQTSSPRWVVGRTMAIYQMVTFGGFAIGSALWGQVAGRGGLALAIALAGALLLAAPLLGRWVPLPEPEGLNLDPSRQLTPEAAGALPSFPETAPIVVTVEYRVDPGDVPGFRAAMRELRRIRRRDGARRWTLMQDVADPQLWVERYQSPNWVEHLRRQHRATVADQEIEARVLGFHRGATAPQTRHLVERPPVELGGEILAGNDPNLPSASALAAAPGRG